MKMALLLLVFVGYGVPVLADPHPNQDQPGATTALVKQFLQDPEMARDAAHYDMLNGPERLAARMEYLHIKADEKTVRQAVQRMAESRSPYKSTYDTSPGSFTADEVTILKSLYPDDLGQGDAVMKSMVGGGSGSPSSR